MYTDFFKIIDTEEKAYWLGFIAADGNIRKDLLECSITLQRIDKKHLEKFAICFDNYYKVKDVEREYPAAIIRIYSKQCCLDLAQYGIVPNKSLTLKVNTELIPQNLIRHYIRGYFDGDGSIFCSHPNRTNGYNYEEWGCNFVGTEYDLEFFKTYFNLSNKIAKKGAIYELDINGTLKAYDVLKELYEDSTISLDRKREKYEQFRSSQRLNKLVSRRDYFAEEKDTSPLVGFILGGATIRNLVVSKTSKYQDLLIYVKEIFEQYKYRTDLVEKNTKYGLQYELNVQVSSEVSKRYLHHFYPNGNKTVTRHLLNELNNDGLSIWFTLNSHDVDGGIALGTLKFTEEENLIIQNYFNVVHHYDVRLRKQREKKYIYLTAKDKRELLSKVYVPRSTLHK